MEKNITVIKGDGIGPEVTDQSIKILNMVAEKFGHVFHYTYELMGACAIDETGDPLPEKTINAALNSDAILFGAIGDRKYDNNPEAKVRPEQGLLRLRKACALYANIRPIKTYKALAHLSPLKEKIINDVDFIIYRELTGGIYFGKKTLSKDGQSATDESTYSVEEITRIAQSAFKQASLRKKKLTLVDKANVLETSRLWRRTVQQIAKEFPEVAVDYIFVDNASMQLITCPNRFDIILTENMFGDIISDEAGVIPGSLGMLPSASYGLHTALFEPIHGSYPEAAGQNIANPMASILSAAMMLEYFGMTEEAGVIRSGVDEALEKGIVTIDLDPQNGKSTSDVGNWIAQYVKS